MFPAAESGAQFQHLLLVLLLYIPSVTIVVPSNLPVFMAMCVLMSFGMPTLFLLPWDLDPVFPRVLPSAVVSLEACLLEFQPWHYSRRATEPVRVTMGTERRRR
ncbi:sodium-dependent lysophosphatidylcholine symporter 1-B-like [Betta splendens]|uniref:Sodium-dependent lysophosphatidylcholine symporter 1-B-like n=1 Tax=Betta splendens TaxID=158456 RepID=A0A8M1HFW4_BETSP|nr:sodium-dependent lysophosphatidylcholine symporter 1-B-like [Betta splendens]